MAKQRNQQILPPNTPRLPRRHVVFKASEPAAQYILNRTSLGEFAMSWCADGLAGFFSVTDLPVEWVTFVQSALNHPPRQAVYSGETHFCVTVWQTLPWEIPDQPFAFCQVAVETNFLSGMLGDLVDSIRTADVSTWPTPRKRLPFHRTLALPDQNSTTL